MASGRGRATGDAGAAWTAAAGLTSGLVWGVRLVAGGAGIGAGGVGVSPQGWGFGAERGDSLHGRGDLVAVLGWDVGFSAETAENEGFSAAMPVW